MGAPSPENVQCLLAVHSFYLSDTFLVFLPSCLQPYLSSHFKSHAMQPSHFQISISVTDSLFHTSLPFCTSHTTPSDSASTNVTQKPVSFSGLPLSAIGMASFLGCIQAVLSLAPAYLPSLILHYSLKHTLPAAALLYSSSPKCAFIHIIDSIRSGLLTLSIKSHQPSYFKVDPSCKMIFTHRGFSSF